MTNVAFIKLGLVSCALLLAGAAELEKPPGVAQVVALDECDPATFNAPNAVGAASRKLGGL